ncbi:MAG: hypothetical protein LUC37_05900 [Prevotella sp.]|nr:hypothetical protein [Prevotella sp.]
MMKKALKIFIPFFPLILASCSNDDISQISALSEGTADVQLRITACNYNDLNATRADGDYYYEYETDGEYMNTLCVFIVEASTGVIEMKFGPEVLDGYSVAQNGNLPEWTSSKITLNTGRKMVYAFSNWDNMECKEWDKLIAKEEGDIITSEDLNFIVEDPASKVDIKGGKYIPMSGYVLATIVGLDADLKNKTQYIDVPMDRLVGQVWVDVQELYTPIDNLDPKEATLYSFLIDGLANNVPMMSNDNTDYSASISYENKVEVSLDGKVIYAKDTPEEVNVAKFYVNETRGKTSDDGFNVSLSTNMYGGTIYTAQTLQTTIARNWIYPIVLTLDQYKLTLEVRAWATVIGGEEREYQTTKEGNYTFTLLDLTSKFMITPTIQKNDVLMSDVDWSWEYTNNDEGKYSTSDDGSITFTQVTATPGYGYNFTLSVKWTINGTSHSRNYTVIAITFKEGEGRTPWLSKTRGTLSWYSQYPWPEYICMNKGGNK